MAEFKRIYAWKLGKNDLESMFVDYSWDAADVYADRLETKVAATQYEVSCKGFATNACKDDYLSSNYNQVRASENWTEVEVSEVTYIYCYVPSAKVSSDHNRGEIVNQG